MFSFFAEDEEIGSPLEDVEGGQVDMLNTLSPAPDEEQDGREGNEVEAEGRGSPEVDRLVAEIQEMHLMVQALLKGSRGTQEGEGEEEEEEGREHKHQVSTVFSVGCFKWYRTLLAAKGTLFEALHPP